MRDSTRDGLIYLAATAFISAAVSLTVVRLVVPAASMAATIQMSMTPPVGAGAAAGGGEFEGYLELKEDRSRPDRIEWKWGYKKVR